VTVSVTAHQDGPWAAELLLSHNGPGKLSTVKLTGTAVYPSGSEVRSALQILGLKDGKIDFDKVVAERDTAVRTALLLNTLPSTVKLSGISIIAQDSDISIVEGSCSEGIELGTGQSCPITVLWKPTADKALSTDLLIRHDATVIPLVIPLRGLALEEKDGAKDRIDTPLAARGAGTAQASLPPPPMPGEQNSPGALPDSGHQQGDRTKASAVFTGVVGGKAVFRTSDGRIVLASKSKSLTLGTQTVTVVEVSSTSVTLKSAGATATLEIGDGL
jgi:hypothetical protein